MTLLDVAQRAGVSVATASRVLNGGDRVPRPELQERVKAAADELGYTPNAQAQALAKSSTNLVGILVHDIEDPYFAAIANGVMRAADERHLLVMMASTFRDSEREIAYLSSLRAQRARAAVMIGSRRTDAESLARTATEVETFLSSGAGLALVSQSGMPAHTIEPDNRSGAAALARELIGLGWRKFAVLGGPDTLATARDRRDGFVAGLAEAGLQPVAVEAGEFTRDGGYAAAGVLLDRQADVDCLFAVNDVMAVGAMSALRARGVDVPGRLGVAGFDDIATLRDVWPGLTTVRLPLEQMGRRALELAIEGGDATTETFKAEVVLRESTARAEICSRRDRCRACLRDLRPVGLEAGGRVRPDRHHLSPGGRRRGGADRVQPARGAQRVPAAHGRRAVPGARPRADVDRRRLRAAHRQRPVAEGRRVGVLLGRRPAHPRQGRLQVRRGRRRPRRSTRRRPGGCTSSRCSG